MRVGSSRVKECSELSRKVARVAGEADLSPAAKAASFTGEVNIADCQVVSGLANEGSCIEGGLSWS